ncbi:MAG: S-methyl-5-thioribose-1-phosphate isomerase, partial [Thermoanaerobaculia bacterium]|nr:S-methyl-5-thioribose-1-phosphate isomerase [Thermoanaerobaculia bacterium]
MVAADAFSPIRWRNGALELLDQTVLPAREEWLHCSHPADVAGAIRRLSVRGAPAIGVAAAYGLVLGIDPASASADELREACRRTPALHLATPPTAVNQGGARKRRPAVFDEALAAGKGAADVRAALLEWAHEEHRKDVETNRAIGENGKALFEAGDKVLTHCNAG